MTDWLRKNRQTIIRVFGSLLTLALLILLIEEEGDGELFSALRRVELSYFLLGLGALFLSRLFAVLRWHILLTSAGVRLSFLRSMMLTFTGNFSSNFLPTTIGGDVARLAGAMQMGYDRAICLASLVADRMIGMAGMALALPLGLVPVFSAPVAATQSLAFSTLYEKARDFVKRTLASFSIWIKKPFALMGALFATLGNQAFIYLSIYFLLMGIDHYVPYWLVAGLYTLTYFVTLVPISINGLGVQELSMTFLLTQFGGLTPSESATIALLTRLLFITASLPGAFFLPSVLAAMNKE
jgi:glycosyltransferase 2 family protein